MDVSADISDINLDYVDIMLLDSNNLMTSSDQLLFYINMDESGINGNYNLNWPANYFKITGQGITEPAGIIAADTFPAEYIVLGYFQENPAASVEDCMLLFDDASYDLTATTCSVPINSGVSKFTAASLKFSNGISSQPVEINQSTFTLYTFGDPLNPKLESTLAPTGDYTVILRTEDLAENENAEIINISGDNTFPFLTSINLSSSVISPTNADGYLDDLTITMNANELVDWGTTRIYNSAGSSVKWFNGPAGYVLSNTEIWDGTLTNGTFAQDGIYTINTTIIDYASNSATIIVGSVIIDNT